MPTNNTDAYNEMCERLRLTITGPVVDALVGYAPELRYGDVSYAKVPAADKIWARFTMAGATERSRTLGKPSRVTYAGIAGVQIFVPSADIKAAERLRRLADEVKTAFAVATANVLFYKAGIRDMPPDGSWLYKRVDATFNYTQMQG